MQMARRGLPLHLSDSDLSILSRVSYSEILGNENCFNYARRRL